MRKDQVEHDIRWCEGRSIELCVPLLEKLYLLTF